VVKIIWSKALFSLFFQSISGLIFVIK